MKIGSNVFQFPTASRGFGSVAPRNIPESTLLPNGVSIAKSLSSIRGQSKPQQVFGQASLQIMQMMLGSIPVVGTWLAAGLGLLAGTGEGQRVVKAVGKTVDQGYEAQKSLFKGDVSGVVRAFEGGSSHKQRETTFFGAVSARILELQTKGGTLTANDIAGFKQAIAYGDMKPLGTNVDLAKINLAVGTNPFREPDLPDLGNDGDYQLRAENVFATQPLYFAQMLEEIRPNPTDKRDSLFPAGPLPISGDRKNILLFKKLS
jgi:hypothetical protein